MKGPDVCLAYQRAQGAETSVRLLPFGEVCRYKWRSQENSVGSSAWRWSTGIWLGITKRTGRYVVYGSALEGGGRPHSDANARVAEVAA